jgi:hypothetical protein
MPSDKELAQAKKFKPFNHQLGGIEKCLDRPSTQEELSDWMDLLSNKVGTGLRHEVVSGEIHGYKLLDDDTRVEIY